MSYSRTASSYLAPPGHELVAVMELVSDGIILFDESGCIEACNTSATRILGYPGQEIIGHSIWTFLPKRDRRLSRQWLSHHRFDLDSNEPGQRVELTAIQASGTEFPVELTVSRWQTGEASSSRLPMFIVAFRDITQHREMLHAKEHAEMRLQRELLVRRLVAMVNDSLDMGVILATTAREVGQFLKVDRAIVTRYNYDAAAERLNMVMTCQYCANEQIQPYTDEDWDVIFRAFQHLTMERVKAYNPDAVIQHDPDKLRKEYEQMFVELGVTGLTAEYLLGLQEKYAVKSSMRTRIYYNDELLGFIMLQQCSGQREWEPEELDLLHYVADQIGIALAQADLYKAEQLARQAEEKTRQDAEKANTRKSEFLAMMSHELRTPLNSVIGFSQMLETGMAGPVSEKQTRYLQHIKQSGLHLLNIVNDLLDISRIESGHLAISPTLFDIRPVVNEVCAMMQENAAKKQISISCTIQPELMSLEADPARFRQILTNLLSNAIKFNNEGGYARLRLSLTDSPSDSNDGGQWLIGEVEDNGIGIPTERQAELFQKFYQVDSRLSRQHEGTGLGLALTKQLVELHGGKITMTSTEGEGCTFTFTLPLTSAPPPMKN